MLRPSGTITSFWSTMTPRGLAATVVQPGSIGAVVDVVDVVDVGVEIDPVWPGCVDAHEVSNSEATRKAKMAGRGDRLIGLHWATGGRYRRRQVPAQ